MPEVGPPTAEGELAQTPFAHLVVYALERKLTGTMLLEEAPDRIHTLTFLRGAPAKIRPADDFVRLGKLLLDEGLVDEATLEGALSTRGLLGDVLVMAGHVEPDALEQALERQFRLRYVRCFTLDGATKYRYYDGVDELADWGAEPTRLDAYELLWAALERHGDRASSMEPSLAALQPDQPLVVHPRAPLDRLSLEGQASDVVELLLLEPTSFPELVELEVAPPELIRKVVFAMLLLRFFDFGKGTLPVGVSADRAPTTLARVQLKQSQRFVAAVEDEVGDGERIPSKPRRKGDPRKESADDEGEPPSSPESAAAPSSGERPSDQAASAPAAGRPAPAEAPAPETTKSPVDPGSKAPPSARPALKPPPKAAGPAKLAAGKAEAIKAAATKPTAAKPAAPRSPEGRPVDGPAARPSRAESDPDSSVRAIRSALVGKPVAELVTLARARLEAKDADAAVEIAEAARERDASLVDAHLLSAFARSLRPHADLKALSLEIDEIVAANEKHVDARYYRGCLRRRLGDDAGARRDFERSLLLDASHAGAARELAALDAKDLADAGKGSGLLGRLFRR